MSYPAQIPTALFDQLASLLTEVMVSDPCLLHEY